MIYTLTFSQAEIQMIANALGELPLKASIGLFMRIQDHVHQHDAANVVSAEELAQMTDAGNALHGGVPSGSAL